MDIFEHDRELGALVAGADEAGRGALAGPIVAAAVLFAPAQIDQGLLDGLNDSKKLTRRRRQSLFAPIIRAAERATIVSHSPSFIDRHGLQRANLDILGRSLAAVSRDGAVLLCDGYQPPYPDGVRRVIGGDSSSAAIAAASILAKVWRDRTMQQLARRYPSWELDQHMGYGTPRHRQLIKQHGLSTIHRHSFTLKEIP